MNYLKIFNAFVSELISRREIIVEMTKRDFRSKYLGSYLGMLWAFVHPTVYIVILWFVFSFAFKSQPVNNVPYVFWLTAGIIPWFFFSDALSSATGSILENSFLVKKMAFSIGILPLVKLISTLVIHLFFICLLFLMFLVSGIPIPIHSVQVLYYLAASLVLSSPFPGDFVGDHLPSRRGQLVAMAQQYLSGAPIFVDKAVPSRSPVQLNPVVYIVEGYRDS